MNLTPQQWSTQLHEALALSHQRLIVDCSGTLSWCQHIALALTQDKKPLVLSDQNEYFSSSHVVPSHKSIQLLGQEFDVVIYDAFSGFDADAFMRAAGLIKAPGVLLLMHPPIEQWLAFKDPKNIWQNKQQGHAYFIKYLQQQLQAPDVYQCHEGQSLSLSQSFKISSKTNIKPPNFLSEQQQLAWKQLDAYFKNEGKSVALIAKRGRGKSTLLGRWIDENASNSKHFIITSSSKNAAANCLRYIQQSQHAQYIAIDKLLQTKPTADCLIVDEAATIPIALLLELKQHYKNVIYTSTIDGYEGTGQGFELQFLTTFKELTLNIIELTEPMRWGKDDLLENWLRTTFMHTSAKECNHLDSDDVTYQMVSQKQLMDDTELLFQVFGLLKKAHYRTQASDLKMLMDNPDISLLTATVSRHVIGVLLLSAEGELSTELTYDIYYGKRRPQGHLLAQGLTVQAGCAEFAVLKGFRIQRIAVVTSFRLKGIGSQLIHHALLYAQQHKADYLGAVFAIDAERLNFWKKNKMSLMMVSVGQGTATGKPSVMMLMPLSEKAKAYEEQCQSQLSNSFSERLLMHFKHMPAVQVICLLALIPPLGVNNAEQCDAYINGFKGFEYALPDLRRYVFFALQRQSVLLSNARKELLVQAILQAQPWPLLVQSHGFSGKKELNKALKEILQKAIKCDF